MSLASAHGATGSARVGFLVQGRVQGVGYRVWARRSAVALGLTGWVRNRADGAVEGEAQGEAESLRALMSSLAKGPPLARVTEVVQWPAEVVRQEASFAVR